jgi:hypothetical protein
MNHLIIWVGQKPPSYSNNKTVVLGTKSVLDRAIKASASLNLRQEGDAGKRDALVMFEILFYKYDDIEVYVLPTKEQVENMDSKELHDLFASFVSSSIFSRDLSINQFKKHIYDAVSLKRAVLKRLMEMMKTFLDGKQLDMV